MRNLTKEIRIAVADGNVDEIIGLLDQGAPMIIEHFVIATQMRLYNVLELYLHRGFDINADVDTLTPSTLVYALNDMTLLTWLLEHGADPNKRCQIRDCTPLSYAVQEASYESIKVLFRYGGSACHGQLLHYAAMRECADNLEVLKYIYNKNSDENATNINKLLDEDSPHDFAMNFRAGLGTPLHFAALAGSLDCVRFLVKKGGNPWILDPYRRTALSLAIYAGHEQVVQFLKDLRTSMMSTQQERGPNDVGVDDESNVGPADISVA